MNNRYSNPYLWGTPSECLLEIINMLRITGKIYVFSK
jgi:hypothetical protein